MPTAPNFFSVERTGYLTISSLFADVMKDMVSHGFKLIKSSNGEALIAYKTEVINSGTNSSLTVGSKLYIKDGTRPTVSGSLRPLPYVKVKSVKNGSVISSKPGASGLVFEVTDVTADYYHPIWETGQEPTNPVSLFTDSAGTNNSTVTIAITQKFTTFSTQVTSGKLVTQTVKNAPDAFSFTVEADNEVDPWNTSTDLTPPGTGAEFTITVAAGNTYSVVISDAGTGYRVDDVRVISGDDLGGATTANDATITVTSVGSNGEITSVSITGTSTGAVGDNFTVPDPGVSFTIPKNPVTGEDMAEYEKQPWRIQFNITGDQVVGGYVGTPLQLEYNENLGTVPPSRINDDEGNIIDNSGALGAAQIKGSYSDDDLDQAFYNRTVRVTGAAQTFPLSYMLSITNRGVFLGIWEGSWSTIRAATTTKSNYFNWVLIQRPVDRNTGDILVRGKSPVFCLNSVNYKYYKTVVRESDVLHPTTGPTVTPGKGNIRIWSNAFYRTEPSTSSKGTIQPNPLLWRANLVIDEATNQQADAYIDTPVGTKIYANVFGFAIGEVKSVVNSTTILFKELPKDPGTLFDAGLDSISTSSTQSPNWRTPGNDASVTREYYVTLPNQQYLRTRADVHSPDNHAILNSLNQIALTEDKTYLLSFPHNLTTPRFRYTEELDMLGTTSSDVVMAGQDIQFITYGETGPRTYRALPPSGPLNTGLRLAVLWAPRGPKWTAPASAVSQTVDIDLGTVEVGDAPGTVFNADPANADWDPPTFYLYRGVLPKGLSIDQDPDTGEFFIAGTVAAAEYTQDTVIRFTIAAKNVEDSGYALREFYFTYKV